MKIKFNHNKPPMKCKLVSKLKHTQSLKHISPTVMLKFKKKITSHAIIKPKARIASNTQRAADINIYPIITIAAMSNYQNLKSKANLHFYWKVVALVL
jgi:hypothetical protein